MNTLKFIILIALTAILFVLNLFFGSVHIVSADVVSSLMGNADPTSAVAFIVRESRLPQAATALIAGGSLSVAGLMLQTMFRNPLAGPSILGISSGASLGVAAVVLITGGTLSLGTISIGGYLAIVISAVAGSFAVMGILLALSVWLRNNLMLLIAGVMIGYLVSSIITLMNFSATSEGIQSYVMWGMGNFSGVSLRRLSWLASTAAVGLLIALCLAKPLNIIQLGNGYARNLGVNLNVVRNLLLVSTGILTAAVTACCGPISFIGLAVPHIARMVFRTDNHRLLLPGSFLCGAVVALACNVVCVLPEHSVLPLNGVTPVVGVPVVLYVILRRRKQ